LQEEINRSIASYLEKASNVQSVDEFESLIRDASNNINQQEIPSLSELHDEQRSKSKMNTMELSMHCLYYRNSTNRASASTND